MNRILIFFLIYLCFLSKTAVAINLRDSQNKIKLTHELNNIILEAKSKYNFTAGEISVLSSYISYYPINIYYGYTSKSSTQYINASSIFQIGSITKTFTALAILKLIKEHKIKLTDTVEKFLPQYKLWNNITIIQLLNQTSGIYDYSDSFLWWFRLFMFSNNWSSNELLKIAYGKSYFKPGSFWHYSNTNYVILGLIIEKVTQKKLEGYFQQNFLNNLNNTFYVPNNPDNEVKSKLAHGYYNNQTDMTNINTSWLQAGGAMLSNANNLSVWYLFFMQQIMANKTILNSFVNINDGKKLDDFSNIGYGFAVFSMPTPYGLLFFTPGLTLGYTSLAGYLPCENISFSYILNNNFNKQNIHQYLLEKILPVIINSNKNLNKKVKCKNERLSNKITFPDF